MDEELDMGISPAEARRQNWAKYGKQPTVCKCRDCNRLRHNYGRQAAPFRRYLARWTQGRTS